MIKRFNTDKLKKRFDVQADRGWFVFPDVTWSFIDKAVQDAFKEGLRTPHSTADGYCCACGYDIGMMEDMITIAKKKVRKDMIKKFKKEIEGWQDLM